MRPKSKITYIEVAQEDILIEQKMRFALVLGRLAILKKKIGADYEQLLRAVYSCFQEKSLKFKKYILASALKSCIIPLI